MQQNMDGKRKINVIGCGNLYLADETFRFNEDNINVVSDVLERNNAVGVVCGRYDEELSIIFASEFFLNSMRYDADDMFGKGKKTFADLLHKSELEDFNIEKFKELDGRNRFKMMRRDGSSIDILSFKKDSVDDNGDVIWMLSVRIVDEMANTDVNDESFAYGMWFFTYDNRGDLNNVVWNNRTRWMLGYQDTEDLPNTFDSWVRLLHPDDRDKAIESYTMAISNGATIKNGIIEFRLKNKTGEYKWYKSNVEIIRKLNGKPFRVVGTLFDINKQKSAEIKDESYKAFQKAITDTNICEYYVDLIDNTYCAFKIDDSLKDIINTEDKWENLVENYIENVVSKEYRVKMKKVFGKKYILNHLSLENRQINVDCKIITGDKETWVRNSIVLSNTDEYGKPVNLAVFMRDITETKLLELKHQSELKDSKHRAELQLNTMTDAIPGGFKICDEDTRYVYVSPQLPKMFGYTMEEYQLESKGDIFGCMYEEDRMRVEAEFANKMNDNGSYTIKYRVVCKNGEIKWISDYGKKIVLKDGSFKYYSFVLDINEQELLTELLAQEKKQYRDALVQNAIYFYSFDVTEGLLKEEYEEKNGLNPFRAMGITLPVKYDEFIEKRIHYLKERGLEQSIIKTFSCQGFIEMYKQGNTFIENEIYSEMMDEYRKSTALLYEDANGHIHAFVICTDITDSRKKEIRSKEELEKAHEAAEDAYKAAERANQAKTIFLNNMSHDIRTPMNAIVGFTNLATTHAENPVKVKDYLKKITLSSNHLLSLINDVLDMSRIESGKMKIDEHECNIYSIMNDLSNILRANVKSKNLNFSIDYENVVNEDIICDKLRLNQVFINCVGNSIKFTKSGGDVGITVIQKPGKMKDYASYDFIIKDTGIGMSQEFAEHIFEPFSREESSTVSGIPGTGLGMAITKSIVDMMNGSISVKSEIGVGTEFTISLNFEIVDNSEAEENEKRISEGNADDNIERFKGIKVLLVEDVELNREIVEAILGEVGMNITSVENGKKAVEFMENAKPGDIDIILMDVMMPVMNGYEATKCIRKLPDKEIANIPIIAMTANAFEEDKKNALSAGMNEHVSKPINIDNLYEVIKRYI